MGCTFKIYKYYDRDIRQQADSPVKSNAAIKYIAIRYRFIQPDFDCTRVVDNTIA